MARGGFDDAAVIPNGGVDQNGVRLLRCERGFEIGGEEGRIEMVLRGVLLRECGVGFYDRDELGGRVLR